MDRSAKSCHLALHPTFSWRRASHRSRTVCRDIPHFLAEDGPMDINFDCERLAVRSRTERPCCPCDSLLLLPNKRG